MRAGRVHPSNRPTSHFGHVDFNPCLRGVPLDHSSHGIFPIGPWGKPSQSALVINAMVMGYSKYPNAAKEYLRFMMEEEQFGAWAEASIGYWCHPLKAYDGLKVWTEDPKHTPYRDVMRLALPQSYRGRPSEAASAAWRVASSPASPTGAPSGARIAAGPISASLLSSTARCMAFSSSRTLPRQG